MDGKALCYTPLLIDRGTRLRGRGMGQQAPWQAVVQLVPVEPRQDKAGTGQAQRRTVLARSGEGSFQAIASACLA